MTIENPYTELSQIARRANLRAIAEVERLNRDGFPIIFAEQEAREAKADAEKWAKIAMDYAAPRGGA